MMPADALPPSLAARLDAAFADAVLISHPAAAIVVEVSDKTLRRLGDEGLIRYRLKGNSWRRYAREDLAAYLTRTDENRPCQFIGPWAKTANQSPASSPTTSCSGSRTGKVVAFTAAQARRTRLRLDGSKPA
jgi:hypothetical protein